MNKLRKLRKKKKKNSSETINRTKLKSDIHKVSPIISTESAVESNLRAGMRAAFTVRYEFSNRNPKRARIAQKSFFLVWSHCRLLCSSRAKIGCPTIDTNTRLEHKNIFFRPNGKNRKKVFFLKFGQTDTNRMRVRNQFQSYEQITN